MLISNRMIGLRVLVGWNGSNPDEPVFGWGIEWNWVDPGWHSVVRSNRGDELDPHRCRFLHLAGRLAGAGAREGVAGTGKLDELAAGAGQRKGGAMAVGAGQRRSGAMEARGGARRPPGRGSALQPWRCGCGALAARASFSHGAGQAAAPSHGGFGASSDACSVDVRKKITWERDQQVSPTNSSVNGVKVSSIPSFLTLPTKPKKN
jgi:hypothetical protein